MNEKIRAYRKRNGLNQEQFAARLKIGQSYLSRIEGGTPFGRDLAWRLYELDPKEFPLEEVMRGQ